jgi:uncharacterized protein YigE (DUF2233 family)
VVRAQLTPWFIDEGVRSCTDGGVAGSRAWMDACARSRHNTGMGALDRIVPMLRANRRMLRAAGVIVAFASVLAVFLMARGQAIATAACEQRTFEGSLFTVCRFDARRDALRLAWQRKDGKALRGFAALADDLGDDAQRVEFAMNAGMFDDDGAPIGILVADGSALHPLDTSDGHGNFYLQPNGVFSVDRDGRVHVEPTAAYAARHAESAWATQSGPMLVIDGALHPAIMRDGPSRTIRNGVGARDAHTALFVISEAPVSFGRFARLFRDDLHCEDALFLDGAVSSLWIARSGRRDSGHEIGPMVVVLDNRP